MNRNSKKTIEAIVKVETGCFDDKVSPPWIILKSDDWFTAVRIYSGISDEEIGLVMFAACLSSSVESSDEIIKETASETLKAFVSDEGFVLSGGLEFKENGEVKVSPGCCGGLEGWNEWYDVPNGNTQIFTGHNPFSLVKIDDGKIKIWDDEENKNESPSIEFAVKEIIDNLRSIEKDLKDFLFRLGQWTKYLAPELEKQVVNHFAKNMNIEIKDIRDFQ